MKLKFAFLILAIGSIMLTIIAGCSNRSTTEQVTVTVTQNPDAHEVLELQPDADIFQWEDVIYKTDIDWVEERELTKADKIGEITNQATSPEDFTNGTANKLPVGAIIYSVKEDGGFLIVEHDQMQKKYMMLVEG